MRGIKGKCGCEGGCDSEGMGEVKNKRKCKRKGIALQAIMLYMLAFVSLLLLLSFFWGPLKEGVHGIYCGVFERFGEPPPDCIKMTCRPQEIEVEERLKENVAREIAAYAYLCFKKQPGCTSEESDEILCYALHLVNNENEINEEDITEIMAKENGCQDFFNNMVVEKGGGSHDYSRCGNRDDIRWAVSESTDYVIKGPAVVLIKYDIKNNVVEIR